MGVVELEGGIVISCVLWRMSKLLISITLCEIIVIKVIKLNAKLPVQ